MCRVIRTPCFDLFVNFVFQSTLLKSFQFLKHFLMICYSSLLAHDSTSEERIKMNKEIQRMTEKKGMRRKAVVVSSGNSEEVDFLIL